MTDQKTAHILFWSGGKDSYLCYLKIMEEVKPDGPLYLLTTYRESDSKIPHQGLDLDDIREQVNQLDKVEKLVAVALPVDCPNDEYVQRVHQAIHQAVNNGDEIHLYFGDWNNEDIRHWREDQFGELDYPCHFPIWQLSMHEILPQLLFHPVTVRISWVDEEYRKWIRVDEPYNQRLVTTLPDEIDPMGENGEFHTRIEFQDYPDDPMKQKVL